ncbi:PseG/SpsG family protein [Maridesulfovibrio frigidus]|uniref:PseG/SpsG family protein n=1 Tax=Maridesulfovibrio frigidus TaxID=340956 RepID=UPI0006893856|nr:glycosyltransferase [Maridesulfovibrio frigidus]
MHKPASKDQSCTSQVESESNPHGNILFFCEGSPERGFGHVSRCLALAAEFKEHSRNCIFVFRGSETARNKISEAGFEVIEVANEACFSSYKFSNEAAVVLDLLIPLEDSFFADASSKNVLICTLDDPTPNRIKSDLAFYPPVPQVKELDWENYAGELFCDWDFIPLRKEFANCASPAHHPKPSAQPEMLITAGGSDPAELTLKILLALRSLNEPFHAKVIVGPMFKNLDKIKGISLELGDKVKLITGVKEMAELMLESDMAVASFGMTAYELAACKTPQLLICLTDDHERSASALHNAGAAISLGRYDLVSEQILIENLHKLISSANLRSEMSSNAEKLGIGDGSSNICTAILKRLELK